MQRYRKTSLLHALRMMTVEEAASALRITPRMMHRCIRSRKLPHFSLTDDGNTIRIIRCDLRTYAIRHRWQLRWLQVMAIIAGMVPTAGAAR